MMAAGHARGVGRRREKMVEGELQQTNSNFNSISGREAKNLVENVTFHCHNARYYEYYAGYLPVFHYAFECY
jgi:hypothetical protein